MTPPKPTREQLAIRLWPAALAVIDASAERRQQNRSQRVRGLLRSGLDCEAGNCPAALELHRLREQSTPADRNVMHSAVDDPLWAGLEAKRPEDQSRGYDEELNPA